MVSKNVLGRLQHNTLGRGLQQLMEHTGTKQTKRTFSL